MNAINIKEQIIRMDNNDIMIKISNFAINVIKNKTLWCLKVKNIECNINVRNVKSIRGLIREMEYKEIKIPIKYSAINVFNSDIFYFSQTNR